jgi:LacI family transcriptional regulator
MTIKEIARKAGVSIGTVDRVIHNRGRVSDKTIKIVKKIIKESGYKPNIFARNLSLSKNFLFGILMPFAYQDTHYWSIPEKGIVRASEELKRYNVEVKFFFFNKYKTGSFNKACAKILASNIDGLLIAPILTEQAKSFLQTKLPKGTPCVLFDSDIPDTDYISYIGQNSYKSGSVVAKLMSLMIKKSKLIAAICVLPGDYHINERARGFVEYCKSEKLMKCKVYDIEDSDNYEAFKDLGDRITAECAGKLGGIFVTNDSVHYMARYIEETFKGDKPHLIGYDLIKNNIAYLEKNIIDVLISQHSFTQGYQGIHTLFKTVVLRENVKNKIMMPIDIIIKENMEHYVNGLECG